MKAFSSLLQRIFSISFENFGRRRNSHWILQQKYGQGRKKLLCYNERIPHCGKIDSKFHIRSALQSISSMARETSYHLILGENLSRRPCSHIDCNFCGRGKRTLNQIATANQQEILQTIFQKST